MRRDAVISTKSKSAPAKKPTKSGSSYPDQKASAAKTTIMEAAGSHKERTDIVGYPSLPGASEMVKQVMQGLRFDELQKLQRGLGVPLDHLSQRLGIGRATLHRRKNSGRLTTDESDKVMRFTRLLQKAEEVFGDTSAGRTWLMSPQRALGGAKPFDYASTEVGALEVDRLLGRIDYGVYS